MVPEPCIIFGSSSLARLICYYAESSSRFDVHAVSVDRTYINNDAAQKFKVPFVAWEQSAQSFPNIRNVLVAIGYDNLNKTRQTICRRMTKAGFKLISFVHDSAHVDTSIDLSENTCILENVTIQPFVDIGKGVIVWSGATICHDSVIEDWCYISPNATICGDVSIGEGSFIGANATVRNGLTVGKHSVIGAGALITKNLEPYSVVPGNYSHLDKRKSDELTAI